MPLVSRVSHEHLGALPYSMGTQHMDLFKLVHLPAPRCQTSIDKRMVRNQERAFLLEIAQPKVQLILRET